MNCFFSLGRHGRSAVMLLSCWPEMRSLDTLCGEECYRLMYCALSVRVKEPQVDKIDYGVFQSLCHIMLLKHINQLFGTSYPLSMYVTFPGECALLFCFALERLRLAKLFSHLFVFPTVPFCLKLPIKKSHISQFSSDLAMWWDFIAP